MKQVKYIIKYLLSLISEPEQTWTSLSKGDVEESKQDFVHSNYYLPLMGIVALGVFILTGWGLEFDIEKAMKSVVIFLAAYFSGPFLAVLLLRVTNNRWLKIEMEEEKLHVFVYYTMSFLMLIQLFASAFPKVKFIAFSSLYLFYIIWCSADFFNGILEKNRWKITTFSFFIIWGAPRIIEYLIRLMIR